MRRWLANLGRGLCRGHSQATVIEAVVVDTFYKQCQYLGLDQGKALALSLTRKRPCHVHGSEALGSLTQLAHVNNTSHTGLPLLLTLYEFRPEFSEVPLMPCIPEHPEKYQENRRDIRDKQGM